MLLKSKQPFLLRKILVVALISTFIYLVGIFGYQHLRYSKVKDRLVKTYQSLTMDWTPLLALLSNYNDVDIQFRLYTIDFKDDIFNEYLLKLRILKQATDTFSSNHLRNNVLLTSKDAVKDKTVAEGKIANLRLLTEQLVVLSESLNEEKSLTKSKIAIVQKNDSLLRAVHQQIENIREWELLQLRETEIKSFASHKRNVEKFEIQLSATLIIMLLMIVLILLYQSKVIRYEKKLQEEKEYAAKIAEEKTTLLANISHEIRTPVASLMSIVELLKQNTTSYQDKSLAYFDSAAHEIDMINSSINDILTLSKLEAGNLEVKNEFFSPHEVLADIITLHHYAAQRKGLLLELVIHFKDDIEIYSSVFRLKQIVSNLLSNAIKYTDNGRVEVTAFINNSTANKQQLRINVQDTGIGIAQEQHAHVFRQYYRHDTKNKSTGFGLGLYISKLLVEQLHGNITLNSKTGEGSTFSLTIPVQQLRIKENKHYKLHDLPKDLRLVCIDDNDMNIFYLKHYFSDTPNLQLFSDPADALTFILKHEVDIVITDLHMPEIDGWEVLNQIRASGQYTPVFLFTADKTQVKSKHATSALMFDGILNKPLDENQLVSMILEALKPC